ncbi:MAG: ABC transporter permease, partial [Gemmatimonadota bacterium]
PAQRRFYDRLRSDLAAAHPRWTVALGFPLPFEGGSGSRATTSLEAETNKNREQLSALIGLVSEDYFKTLGVALKSGREVGSEDRADGPKVAVVNAAFAKRWWPAREAVGQEFAAGFGGRITVIGVVADSRSRQLDAPPEPMFYLPYRQLALPYLTLLIRTSDGLGDVVRQVRSTVKTIDPNLPIGEARPFAETIDRAVAAPRFRTSLLGGFAALALLLGAVGVYGLLSYLVTIGRREVGIQLALGATPGRVVWRTTWRGLRLAIGGIGLGLIGSVVLTRFLSGFLYEVRPIDPATLAMVSAVLALVAFAASYVPARRAAAVDPAISLRDDA